MKFKYSTHYFCNEFMPEAVNSTNTLIVRYSSYFNKY